ncbi:thioredoxin domain-containing protein [Christiangramia aquimixticola]|uniref:thioredoxin domain-containing protein n=1 Tax=Christiangramia aquimixticola TaxID=1697558 RepID=UPI003AA7C40A
MENNKSNALINETSPYLLQHAYNPVDWHPWNDESLDLPLKENKLLLISVGYSACHWCHVMEHESFEDHEVAKVMNANYINIKVDREERPDVDQVYMNAVQVMTGAGGWPMNIVALPDGRPVWGGTYFRKEQWINALSQISHLYETQPEKLLEYAEKLEKGLQQINLIEPAGSKQSLEPSVFKDIMENWKSSFDHKNGGYNRSPKFMMPNNYDFLLRYAYQTQDQELQEYCKHTFNKISWGGVFDPVAGGFSRYSVDEKWHVPHFEKMLYDNAQLVESYARLYKLTKDEWYKEVVEKTLNFVNNELSDASGAFYSALDADSKNEKGISEEGAYYVWTKAELEKLLGEDFRIFSTYFNFNSFGKWEAGNYVLIRTQPKEEIAASHEISVTELNEKIENCLNILAAHRSKRVKPGLDDKSLTSWNAMMISGYCEAYKAFGNKEYLERAIKGIKFIEEHLWLNNDTLQHTYKNGRSHINGYLEDYAFVIKALLDLYEANFDEFYLQKAEELFKIAEQDFLDEASGLFYFTSSKDRKLVTRNIEISDNVIPASNSVMAKNYYRMGQLMANMEMISVAENMLGTILPKISEYPQSYSNWLDLLLNFTHDFYEVAVSGKNSVKKLETFQRQYLPNVILAGSSKPSELPILKQRYKEGEDLIYICTMGTCSKPIISEVEALQQLSEV